MTGRAGFWCGCLEIEMWHVIDDEAEVAGQRILQSDGRLPRLRASTNVVMLLTIGSIEDEACEPKPSTRGVRDACLDCQPSEVHPNHATSISSTFSSRCYSCNKTTFQTSSYCERRRNFFFQWPPSSQTSARSSKTNIQSSLCFKTSIMEQKHCYRLSVRRRTIQPR